MTKNVIAKSKTYYDWTDGTVGSRPQNVVATAFDATENPISESGRWTVNTTDGYNAAVQTGSGFAYGTQTGAEALESPPRYNDSQAILSGFAKNHRAELTIHSSGSLNGDLEVECLLGGSYGDFRNSFGPTYFDGVEINLTRGEFGTLCYVARYLQIGTIGVDYDEFSTEMAAYGPANGDIFCSQLALDDASQTGVVVVSMIRSGIETVIGTTPARANYYRIGNPGIAFFRQNNGTSDDPKLFCATAFSAWDTH